MWIVLAVSMKFKCSSARNRLDFLLKLLTPRQKSGLGGSIRRRRQKKFVNLFKWFIYKNSLTFTSKQTGRRATVTSVTKILTYFIFYTIYNTSITERSRLIRIVFNVQSQHVFSTLF